MRTYTPTQLQKDITRNIYKTCTSANTYAYTRIHHLLFLFRRLSLSFSFSLFLYSAIGTRNVTVGNMCTEPALSLSTCAAPRLTLHLTWFSCTYQKPTSLWWTSTYADEKMEDIKIRTTTSLHKLPFDNKFKILGYTCKTAWRRGCRVRTRPGGEMRRSTEAKMYHEG